MNHNEDMVVVGKELSEFQEKILELLGQIVDALTPKPAVVNNFTGIITDLDSYGDRQRARQQYPPMPGAEHE